MNFTVVFDESVAGVDAEDVTLSGTAGTWTSHRDRKRHDLQRGCPGDLSWNRDNIQSEPIRRTMPRETAIRHKPAPTTRWRVEQSHTRWLRDLGGGTRSPTNGMNHVTASATVDDAANPGNSKIVSAYYRMDNGSENSRWRLPTRGVRARRGDGETSPRVFRRPPSRPSRTGRTRYISGQGPGGEQQLV